MFSRPNESYNVIESSLNGILSDEANSLYRILQLVDYNSKIIDIGAGNGVLSRVIKQKYPNIIIDGIEPSNYAAKIAKQNYRNFYVGYADDFLEIIKSGMYDYVIMADVIEHMADPYTFLLRLISVIPNNCKIILSVPNIAFGLARIAILNGNFDYTDSGLLEKTHLRFFTLKTLKELIANVELYIEKLYFQRRSFFQEEIKIEKYKINPFVFFKIINDPLAYTYQFLTVLSKNPSNTELFYTGKKDNWTYIRYLNKRCKISFIYKIINYLSVLKNLLLK